jgi:hypothetical protein
MEDQMKCNCLDTTQSKKRPIYDYKNTVNFLPEVSNLTVVQCTRCGLVFTSGFPSDPTSLSRINLALGVTFDTGIKRAHEKAATVSRILKMSNITDYEIIDVGGGSGIFSKIAIDRGILSHNFEPFSKKTQENSLSAIQARVRNPNLVLTMFHVVEHIYDPIAWLSELIAGLQRNFENVFLLIEVPCIELETSFCDDPTPFYAPFHIRHFSIHTARATLALAGLEILREKASNNYNGYFFLVKPNLGDLKNDISIDHEFKVHDDYVLNYEHSMQSLRTRLRKSLIGKTVVIFWGAGIGYDFFSHNFGDLFTDLPQVIVDKSVARQNEKVLSPEKLREIFESSSNVLVIPTSFAKSEEIIDESLEILQDLQSNSIELFEYIHVRAY